jgi:hypothetical protein
MVIQVSLSVIEIFGLEPYKLLCPDSSIAVSFFLFDGHQKVGVFLDTSFCAS